MKSLCKYNLNSNEIYFLLKLINYYDSKEKLFANRLAELTKKSRITISQQLVILYKKGFIKENKIGRTKFIILNKKKTKEFLNNKPKHWIENLIEKELTKETKPKIGYPSIKLKHLKKHKKLKRWLK